MQACRLELYEIHTLSATVLTCRRSHTIQREAVQRQTRTKVGQLLTGLALDQARRVHRDRILPQLRCFTTHRRGLS